jgi:UDP-N-acetylglucosamine acyltransferase
MFMTTSHVGHNCFVGDEVILSNVVLLAGHVQIHDWCIIGGNVALPQYLRMGKGTFMGGFSAIRQDLPPFFRASGLPGGPAGINRVGMARRGISAEAISAMHQAYKILYLKKLPLETALEKIDNDFGQFAEIQTFIDFIRTSKLGIVRPRSDRGVR